MRHELEESQMCYTMNFWSSKLNLHTQKGPKRKAEVKGCKDVNIRMVD